MNIQDMGNDVRRVLKLPTEAEFLTLCASFTQYTGKKIKILFLEKPVKANKFIEVVYDEHICHFINSEDMASGMTGIIYADLVAPLKGLKNEQPSITQKETGNMHL